MADNPLERTSTMNDLSGMTNPSFLKDEDLEYVPNEKETTKGENLKKGVGVGGKDGPCGLECSAGVTGVTEGCRRGCSGGGMDPEAMLEARKEKLAIIKNLLVISLAFVCLFTSFNAVLSLQSSLNKEMGTAALVALYVAMVISCCLLPTYVVRKLGEKWTLFFSAFSYLGYYVAQFYPQYYTLIPAAFVLGIGAAPLWSAKSTYVTKVAERYAQLTNQSSELVITRFFGIFFLFFQSTNIWGNLISSTVLSTGVDESETEEFTQGSNCGYHFCIASSSSPANASHMSSDHHDKELTSQQYIIFSVFLVCGLLSSLVVLFVDPLTRFVKAKEGSVKSESQLIAATFNHMRHPYQLLLLPITVWSGLEQQFLTADYAAAYVTCSLGVHRLGFVLIAHGVSDSLSCLIIASLMKQMGRVPGFVVASVINLVLLIVFVYWYPSPEHLPWFFVCAALWGLGDAVWQTQINALYSVIFPGDSTPAAFSNYRLWESVGMIIANASSTALCVDSKITVNLIFLLLGMAGYAAVELIERKGGLRTDREGAIVPIDKLLTKSL